MEEDQLLRAIGEAAARAAPGDDASVVIGDHVSVVEIIAESNRRLVVLAPTMTPAHLSLLIRAIDEIVTHFVADPTADDGPEDEADAT